MADEVREILLAVRRRYPTRDPRKILAWLVARDRIRSWPTPAAVGDLLRREGLERPRRRQRAASPHPGHVPARTHAANELWTVDFKGQFRTRDWDWSYPLTILRPVFERAFREVGMPEAIRGLDSVPYWIRTRPAKPSS